MSIESEVLTQGCTGEENFLDNLQHMPSTE